MAVKRLLVVLVLAQVGPTLADTLPADSLRPVDTLPPVDSSILVDTSIFRPGSDLQIYTAVTDSVNLEKRLTQHPTLALFKSLVVPGWGQLGNRRYVKAILFAGLDAWLVSSAVRYGRQAADFRDQFDAITLPLPIDSCIGDPDCSALRIQKVAAYDDYRDRTDQRNKFIWFAVITTFVSMFDAYVDAHLSGFPRQSAKDGFSVDVRTTPAGSLSAVVSIPF